MTDLIKEVSELSESIRYVAIYQKGQLDTWQRESIQDASSGESDKYEELLVNPAILKLAQQRGNIDCGGLNYVIIRYGNFFQLIRDIADGHISVCIAKEASPTTIAEQLNELLAVF